MKQGWEIKKLGDVCQVSAGQGAPQGESNYGSEGKPFIKAGSLEGLLSGVQECDIPHINDEIARQHRLKIYPKGSVLFAKSGMSCMKGYVYALQSDCYVVSHLAILTPNGVTTNFLTYLLNFYRPNTLVKDSAYPSISLEDIKSFSVPVPPIAEQEKIVAELDCLSGIIEKKKQQLKELDNIAQSIFYEMFGDPVENDKGWKVKKFPECYKLTSGKNLTAKKIVEGDYPVYGGNGIVGYHNDYNLDGENIIIGRVGALCGNVRNVLGKAYITDNAFILSKIENCWVNVFILHLLERHNLRQYARDALQPVVSNTGFKNIDIIIPPISLQQNFASKIESIEKQKGLIAQSIKETETLFNSRMDYYFN